MSKLEAFLSTEEEQDIIEAIQNAEKNTSGEIRIHIEQSSKEDAYKRAVEVFHSLKMDDTKLRNGVLIYVAVADKTFAIYGDKGINTVVADNFWDTTRDTIQQHFKSGNFKQGLVEGIKEAGIQLKTYFPWQQDDANELSNEISKG
jgi:uncharacterized membrane protein